MARPVSSPAARAPLPEYLEGWDDDFRVWNTVHHSDWARRDKASPLRGKKPRRKSAGRRNSASSRRGRSPSDQSPVLPFTSGGGASSLPDGAKDLLLDVSQHQRLNDLVDSPLVGSPPRTGPAMPKAIKGRGAVLHPW